MADQRGYNLADTISSWDGDLYLNVDKSGFSRAKSYKLSVLQTHLENGLVSVKVELDAADVAALGTATELLTTPGANKSYQLVDIKWAVYPTTTLDVGTQNLIIYFEDVSLYLAMIRNDQVESATFLGKGVQIQAEHEWKVDKRIYCKLSGGVNPASGAGTMAFWLIYKVIDV